MVANWRDKASQQRGVITRKQLDLAGLSRRAIERRIRKGELVRVLRGVYRVGGAPRDHAQELMAAVLYAGTGCAVSGGAAARLHRFPRLGSKEIEVSSRRNLRRGGFGVRRMKLGPREITQVQGLPVTTPLRTLVDLAESANEDDLRSVVDHLLREGIYSGQELAERLSRYHSRGVATLRRILSGYARGGATESELEAKFLDRVREWDLPMPEKQRPEYADGVLRRLDFSWPSRKIVAEVDGYRFHSDPAAFERDRRRNNSLVAKGWRVLHVTDDALEHDQERLYSQLSSMLGETRRGAV